VVDAFGPRAAYVIGGVAALLATLVLLRPMRAVAETNVPVAD
jgi:hypothetical protein